MASSKSTGTQERTALSPQRRPGQERVAALLEAAAVVIAEKGYDATTMAEVAARAGAQIGSLYRFFPNKDVLASALIERFHDRAGSFFDAIDQRAGELSVAELTDALLDLLGDLRSETQTIVALLEGRAELSDRRLEFRRELRKRIARTLINRCPKLRKGQAEDAAAVLLQNMKSIGALTKEIGNGVRPSALVELRVMTRHYLEKIFADAGCRE
ncbi:TetR/AcrR family transcriptional regulator [Hyphomicrobium sp. MC1]|uniref:TetR/AcrR family transcriptional regulator n=1 Tax=Hyphomicrobium sp. (strain MC1) TaxID=717785 RepID=UPI000213F91C|nr:TetR/AcrR family transcriptional regulator [Hyphomicrobium sp. MC1]CCB63630.1 putative transcriptional regulator, TetR family [Hyphomicrobium sp. MC1]